MKLSVLGLLACLVCGAAAPVRLQVQLSGGTSVKAGSRFTAEITLLDAHAARAPAATSCAVHVSVEDADSKRTVQQLDAPPIARGSSATSVNLVLRAAGFYGIRAATDCARIQGGLIYVRATSGRSALWPHAYLLQVAQPLPKGSIDVFYPQDANSLTADGKNKAEIQVFVSPPVGFTLAFDSGATVSPNPLVFPATSGDAVASLTSSQPGDFTATVSPSSIPSGYVLHTHPPTPPMHHFVPDIEFLQVTSSSRRGVPVNSAVTITIQLLDGAKRPVNALGPVAVNLTVEPGSASVKDNPLTIAGGQSSGHTSLAAPAPGHYSVDADWGEAKSTGAAPIDVTAPIGFIAILLGGLVGGCISCLWLRRFEWPRVIYGGLAATGVWLVSGIGVFASVSASLVSNSYSAAILGALAGLAGEQVLTILVKKLFGAEEPPPAEPPPPAGPNPEAPHAVPEH